MMKYNSHNQRGITLLEILAVLVIIALVFIALSRNFGFGTDKAKVTDVQQAFKPYQIGFESMMNEYSGLAVTSGTTVDYNSLNRYLGTDYKLTDTTNGGTNPIKNTQLLDPWNRPYQVQAKYLSPKESMLIIRSAGKDKTNTVTTDLSINTQATTDKDDLVFISHYKNGKVKSCTKGLAKDVGVMDISGAGGGGTTPANYDIPIGTRQPYIDTYPYEYVIQIDTIMRGVTQETARTYVYSHSPLTFTTSHNGDILSYRVWYINETNNKPFVALNTWEEYYDEDFDIQENLIHSPPQVLTSAIHGVRNSRNNNPFSVTNISGMSANPPNTILSCK